MIFHDTQIKGCYLIESQGYVDERGEFRRHFDSYEMALKGCNALVRQANLSINPKRGTWRGFHFQGGNYGEAKTISCITGRIMDYVIDLRPNSETYLKTHAAIVQGPYAIHVPAGIANAFMTSEDNTIAQYYVSERYHPECEYGIRWDDPIVASLQIPEPEIISTKDATWPSWTP